MKTPRLKISRRRFFGGVSVAAIGTLGYARFIEAERLQTGRFTIPLTMPTGYAHAPLKLLHLSDLHASPVVSLEYINEAISLALAWKPDLICVTGDFITSQIENGEAYGKILQRLPAAAPTYASLGNHDGGRWAGARHGHPDQQWITGLLQRSGLTLLQNTATPVCVRDWTLNLVGVGDLWSGSFNPAAAFHSPLAPQPTVLLSHNPDSKDVLLTHPWDLMLSGHTHGGQLRLPLIGTPFAPVQDKRFVEGLHRWNNRWLHITKGVGNVLGLRINCPPEISFLTLT